MSTLIGIVCLHFLVIIRAKQVSKDGTPYFSVFFITAALVVFVVAMMFNMVSPEQ